MKSSLDEYQLKFYNEPLEPDECILLKAVAGSGKTHTVIAKALKLIEEGIDPQSIVLTSFTNVASRELYKRISRQTEEAPVCTTTHRLGRSILNLNKKYRDFSTLTDWQSTLLMREQVLKAVKKDEEQSLGFFTNVARNCLDTLAKLKSYDSISPQVPIFAQVYDILGNLPSDDVEVKDLCKAMAMYEEEKAKIHAFDYDDLLWRGCYEINNVTSLVQALGYKYLFIDEAQDLNHIQYRLVIKLANVNHGTLCLIGDACQSIYGFRHATPKHFTESYLAPFFKKVKTLTLENNYRSQPKIVELSNIAREVARDDIKAHAVKASTPEQHVKIKVAKNNIVEGQEITARIKELLLSYSYEDIIVICRSSRYIKTIIEPAMVKAGIPYTIVGGNTSQLLTDRPLAQFIVSCISYALNPSNYLAILDIAKELKGFGEVSLEHLKRDVHSNWRSDGRYLSLRNLLDSLNLWFEDAEDDTGYNFVSKLEDCVQDYLPVKTTRDPEYTQDIFGAVYNYITLQSENGLGSKRDILEAILSEINLFNDNGDKNSIRLATIHSQKGAECPAVIASGFTSYNEKDLDDEEANMIYVQFSRAIKSLDVIFSKEYVTQSGNVKEAFLNDYLYRIIEKVKEGNSREK